LEYEFRFPLPLKHGLHARPATVLQVEASAFASDVRLVNERNGREANAKSVLSLVAADIHHGDACLLLVSGDEAARAFPVLRDFLLDVFPGCDEPLPEPEAGPGAVIIPRVLTRESATFYQGTPASPGIGEGAVFLTEGLSLPAAAEMPGAPQEEEACFARALAGTGAVIEKKLLDAHNATERAILEAHLAIVRDPEFSARVRH
jgi:fructose-specific PTS system IIA-like component